MSQAITSNTLSASASSPLPDSPRISRPAFWIGWVLGVLPAVLMLFSAGMKFSGNPEVIKGFEHLGWPDQLAITLGILELGVTLVYLIPQTAVLGAILLTGYLGGATATHVRIGEPWHMTVIVGMMFWFGLYLREPQLRILIPLRQLHRVKGN
jgi:hypothetical protein